MSYLVNDVFPAGIVLPYAGATAPDGWRFCNGDAISRTTFARLFAAISTTYGAGDTTTTFNLPNTQGVFLRGAGSQVISASTYSATRGTKQNDQNLSHSHTVNSHNHGGGSHRHNGLFTNNEITQWSNAFETGPTPMGGKLSTSPAGNGNQFTTGTTSSVIGAESPGTDSVGGAETRPANLGVNYIIKL